LVTRVPTYDQYLIPAFAAKIFKISDLQKFKMEEIKEYQVMGKSALARLVRIIDAKKNEI
jgi:hypothetical protein